MTTEEQKILERFNDYSATLETLDPEAVVPYIHAPVTIINPALPQPVYAASETKIIELFTQVIAELKATQYKYSKITQIGVRQLSQSTAIVSGKAQRFDHSNAVIAEFGFTYTMTQAQGSWQIILGVIHNPETAISLTGTSATPSVPDFPLLTWLRQLFCD